MKEDLLDWAKGAYRDAIYLEEKRLKETVDPRIRQWVLDTLMPALDEAISNRRVRSFYWIEIFPNDQIGDVSLRAAKLLAEVYGFEEDGRGWISGWAE